MGVCGGVCVCSNCIIMSSCDSPYTSNAIASDTATTHVTKGRVLATLSNHYLCVCVCRYSVENAYMEEKEDTCNALGEIAENVG